MRKGMENLYLPECLRSMSEVKVPDPDFLGEVFKENGLEPDGALREALAAWRERLEAKRRELCARFDAESDPKARLNLLAKIWKCVYKARLLDELLGDDVRR